MNRIQARRDANQAAQDAGPAPAGGETGSGLGSKPQPGRGRNVLRPR
jgi:hypothetical protein